MVIVRDIEFASTSETDLLPFYGRCHVAYVPKNGVVLGLSKLARVTKLYAQQRLTSQILVALQQDLAPVGAAIVMEARHLAHGPEASFFMTSASSGCFQDVHSSCMQVGALYTRIASTYHYYLAELMPVPAHHTSGQPNLDDMLPFATQCRDRAACSKIASLHSGPFPASIWSCSTAPRHSILRAACAVFAQGFSPPRFAGYSLRVCILTHALSRAWWLLCRSFCVCCGCMAPPFHQQPYQRCQETVKASTHPP